MLDLHDYYITGLQLNSGCRDIVVSLTDPSGSITGELLLPNVTSLFVDGFGLQNIVLETKLFIKPEDSFEYKRACDLLSLDRADSDILGGSKMLFFIEASIGAELACVLLGQPKMIFSS